MKIVAITPARNEAQYLPILRSSMERQLTRPALWLIVDDGSKDPTPQFAQEYARTLNWVQVRTRPDRGHSYRGKGVAETFSFGVSEASKVVPEWELLAKIDADTELPESYFTDMCKKFEDNPKLGIASGTNVGEAGILTHPRGNNRVYRRACWDSIDGLPAISGWDTWDEIKARSRGWEAFAYEGIRVKHHRPESATFEYSFQQGKISRYLGYSWLIALGRSVKMCFGRNPVCALGYFLGYLAEGEKIEDNEFIDLLRGEQRSRLMRLLHLR